MPNGKKYLLDAKFDSRPDCRWNTYGYYKLILWAWMLNEVSIMFSPTELSHSGFYIHGTIYAISAILIGIPLVYSEICLAQYTNNEAISMWDYFPLLRAVGYGSVFLVFIKALYIMALASWYLQYSFYAAFDPPPWNTCEDYNTTKCMVKRVNVSIFQHCLEAQTLFDEDCGVLTASNCFFQQEIGNNNSQNSLYCPFSWKSIVASVSINLVLFILSLRKVKFFQISVKLLAVYVCAVILLLLCVSLSTSGAWYATKITIDWNKYNFSNCYKSVARGFLSVGTGYGIIGFLSRDVPFRSPATMTSITAPLFSIFVTLMYSLVAFSGIKTMSYYHGEEENVIEMGDSTFFLQFASISEIVSYFAETPLWGFVWFSSVFLCLFINLWILHLFLQDFVKQNVNFARRQSSLCSTVVAISLCIFSWPLFCTDITGAVTDAIEIMQFTSSFFLSISLYWIYGYKNHNIDIIFMIGIKASYFWKIAWILNPIWILSLLLSKCVSMDTSEYDDSHYLKSLAINLDSLVVYCIVAIYVVIILVSVIMDIIQYLRFGMILEMFYPTQDWGPKDSILFKSRKMFVPEIMTREFLYRQVRIYGYSKKRKIVVEQETHQDDAKELFSVGSEWSALTSN